MRIVVRDHNRNRREVYNVRTARSIRNDRMHNIKDADDDKLEELEERVKTLEKKLEKLTSKPEDESEDVEVEEDVDMDESDMDEEPVEEDSEEEDEVVEDLGDSFGCRDSLKPRSLKSIGALAKNSTKDSIDSDDAEINAWKNR